MDYLVYFVVRATIALVQLLPWDLALGLARLLAWVAYRVNRRHRLVAAEKLRCAFPELDDAAIDALVRRTYRHFITVAVEMMKLPRVLRRDNYQEFTHWVPADAEARGIAWARCGRPLLILTGHLGNWEVLGYTIGLVGLSAGIIARKLDNPYLERFVLRLRQSTGQTIIAKKDDFARLTAVLAGGGKVGTLADQDAGPRGVFVNFFGRPASTHKAIALMAIEFGALIVVSGVPRVSRKGRESLAPPAGMEETFYAVEVEAVIDPRDYAGRPDAIHVITALYTSALERLIRRHPEQYFWLHRRWKHQPKARASEKKAA